jgi:Tetracyclin repressor-like, C-terminal domain
VKDSSDFAANGALGKAFREQIVSMRLGEVRRLIERAIGRGEIQSDVDVVLVTTPASVSRTADLLSRGKLDRKLAERIVDSVLPGVTPDGKL